MFFLKQLVLIEGRPLVVSSGALFLYAAVGFAPRPPFGTVPAQGHTLSPPARAALPCAWRPHVKTGGEGRYRPGRDGRRRRQRHRG